ncbi:MAG: ATP-binding protein [Verrucomicrobiota bacterium]
MKPSELKKNLSVAFSSQLKFLIKGQPGIGKTDIVHEAARDSGSDVVLMHPAVSDPVDFKGLPAIVNNLAEFLPYGQLRKLVEASKPTVCFIDDIGQAPHAVQAALMQLIQAREIDGQKISDLVTFCGATNDSSHMAGVTSILEPVKSRWHSIVTLEADQIEWVRWAKKANLREEILAFVMFRGMDVLCNFKPTRDLTNSPSPRTVTNAARLFGAGLYSREALAGAAGEGWASEFLGFLQVYRTMPDPDDCLKNPKTAPVPSREDASTLYALAVAISLRTTKANFANAAEYLKRLPKEHEVFAIRDALNRESDLQNTGTFTQWAVANVEVLS